MNWARIRRGLLGEATVFLGLLAVIGIAVFVVTQTDWGRERVRRIAVQQIANRINGRVRIGRLRGNLLDGVTAENVAISDSTGQPFLVAESVHADYSLGALLRQRVWLDNVRLIRPLVVLDRPPDSKVWNYQRIFKPRNKPPVVKDTTAGWGTWIRLTDVSVVDGHLVVRTPWHPSERLVTQVARDSAIEDVLSGGSRLMVRRVPGGFQKIVELQSLSARAPLVRLADPSYANRQAVVAALEMNALPFRPPAAKVTAMKGTFQFNNDSVWWNGVNARLPDSRISGDGRYTFTSGDMTLVLHGAPANMGDLRWLYPRLPSNGYGTLDFVLNWQGAAQDYIARNADVHVGAAHLTGSFGLTLTDTFTLHQTDLRFANVDTRLLEQVVPHLSAPWRGALTGHAVVSGGKHALFVNGETQFAAQRAGTSDVGIAGEVGFMTHGLRAQNLRLAMHPLQVELARKWLKTAPVSGAVSGTALVNGNTANQLAIVADLTHTDRGASSRVDGHATVTLASANAPMRLTVDANAHPLSLIEVGRFAPSLGLQGNVAGPIHLAGTTRNLRFRTDLALPAGGRLAANGLVGLGGAATTYQVNARARVANLATVIAKAPRTSITAQVSANGRGFTPATMQAQLAANFSASAWDSVRIDTGAVRVAVSGGLLDVRQVLVRGNSATANIHGTFGLVAGRTGELTYQVAIDSLGAFNRFVPRSATDTGAVAPRPGRVAAALAKARADSARIAQATEVERAVTGAPPPKLAPVMPAAIQRDTLAGSVVAAGTLRGNLQDFDLRGRLAARNLIARGNAAQRLRAEYAWTNARTPDATLALGVEGDSVQAGGFSLDSVSARVSYRKPGGHVEMLVRQDPGRTYALHGDYALGPRSRELHIADAQIQMDTVRWATARPAVIRWSSDGLLVQTLDLRDGEGGRIYANGLLPTQGQANFQLEVSNLQLGDVTALLQSDIPITGVAMVAGTMQGTLSAPTFNGAFGVTNATYSGSAIPDLRGTFAYANQRLTSSVRALRAGGSQLAYATGEIPINLALQGVTGPRMLPGGLALDVTADSLPLDLIPSMPGMWSHTSGLAVGRVVMRGTFQRPSLVGALAIRDAKARIDPLGVQLSDINGAVRMLNDTVFVDSLVAQSHGPVRLRGSLGVGSWRAPSFDLYLVAHNALVLNTDLGRLYADAGVALTGPFTSPYLSGQVTVTQGVIYPPSSSQGRVLSAGDPGIFNVVDTAVTSEVDLIPKASPFMQGLRMDAQVAVNHNTWVRRKDANVEVYTEYPVVVRMEHHQLTLLGSVNTDRGEYTFLSKRFQIKRGSAMFTGSTELNPLLQITAEYEVSIPGQPALNIRVLVGGTMRKPSLSLESDAQPPKSQSELLSYLAFGRSSTSLLDFGSGTSVTTLGSGSDLVGFGAALAVRRLTGVALGVAADQLENEAGRALGTDYFNVTPADVPPELVQGRGVVGFLYQTRFEAGKYLNPRTFVGVQEAAGYPGAQLQYRAGKGWQYQLSAEPRVLVGEPTLAGPRAIPTTAFGAIITREWRF